MSKTEDNPWDIPYPGIRLARTEKPERIYLRRAVYNTARKVNNGENRVSTDEFDALISVIHNAGQFDWRTRRAAAGALGRVELTGDHKITAADSLINTLRGVQHNRIAPRVS